MKVDKLFRILLLFLCTIGFISCSNDKDEDNDNNPEYHLELAQNSCEVMQERNVAIKLTTHENTTFDIANPNLIDILYTWEFGNFKAKIEIKGKQKGETDIVVTDHETGESATIKVKVTEYPMPRLAVDHPEGNIFDMMNFHLYNEGSQPINTSDLAALCDSIVWTANGQKGSFKVFEHREGINWVENHLTMEWGHCFKYPGEYKTHLTAWKDNKIIFRHQLDLSVTNNKDFLVNNWSDITKGSQAWSAYVDVFKSSPDLITSYGLSGNVPFAEVKFFNNETAQSDQQLYDYFHKLYSAPAYEDKTDKQKMWQLYDELFSEQKKYPDAYPVAIWVTEHTNIVLLLLDEAMEYPGYVVYAEPKRDAQ